MNLSDFILYLSITFAIAIAAYSIISTKLQQGKGWYMLREGILRVFLPLVISIAWMAYCKWNYYSFIILIGFLTSAFVYVILAQTEYFLGTIAKFDCLGRFDLYFHRFLKKSDTIKDVKIYHYREINLKLNHILANIRDEINKDPEKNKIEKQQLIEDIDRLETEFEDTRIFYLFYVDTRDAADPKKSMYKCLVYVTKRELPSMRKIEGQLLESSFKQKFYKRGFNANVLFDIEPTADFAQKLEANLEVLTNVLVNSKDTRMIPVYIQRIEQARKRNKMIMEAFHSETAENIMTMEALGQKPEPKQDTNKMFTIMTIAFIALIVLIATFIILLAFGVI